jgi:serine protease Do
MEGEGPPQPLAETPAMLTALPIALCLLAQRPSADTPSPADIVTSMETVVADAVAKAEPSVVAITRMKGDKGDATLAVRGRNQGLAPFQLDDSKVGEAVVPSQSDFVVTDFGSGVVIGDKGEILTAFHVVRGARHLIVRASGRQQFEAEVIAADPRSDLAVIAPRDQGDLSSRRPRLTPIALGDASKLRKGCFLLALGNPFNAGRDGSASASLGILSNVSRRMESTDIPAAIDRQLRHYPTLLQLDAKLNLGMSGGAVINMKGELVGITTNVANVSAFDAQAGYAIPIDARGRRAVDALRQGKEVEYGFLGISLPDDSRVPTNRVGSIRANTRAAEAGLSVDDVIHSIGGIPVVDAESMVAAVNTFAPGQTVKLKIQRGDQRLGRSIDLERSIILSKLPVRGEVIATNQNPPWRGIRVDYVSTLPDTGLSTLDRMSRGGVAITEIIPGSPADIAGLRSGQVIRSVDGKSVRSPAEFAKAVADASGPVDLATETEPKVTIP